MKPPPSARALQEAQGAAIHVCQAQSSCDQAGLKRAPHACPAVLAIRVVPSPEHVLGKEHKGVT